MKAEAPIGCRRCGSPVGTGLPSIVGAGFIPPGGVCPAAGVRDDASIVPYRGLRCGKVAVSRLAAGLPLIVGAGFIPPGDLPVPQGPRDDASIVPYRGLRHDKVAVSRLGTGLPLIVGADSISARGRLRCRRARRDEGIPPYERPGGFAAVRFGGWFRKVCRGGIYPARGTLRRRRVPGTISGLRAGPAARLASETRLRAQCKHRPLQGFAARRGCIFPVGRRVCPAL